MSQPPRPARAEVKLDASVQERLLQQMREEAEARRRGRALRRYVALPLVLLAILGSAVAMLYGNTSESIVGNIVLTAVLWFLWKIRNRVGNAFGFG